MISILISSPFNLFSFPRSLPAVLEALFLIANPLLELSVTVPLLFISALDIADNDVRETLTTVVCCTKANYVMNFLFFFHVLYYITYYIHVILSTNFCLFFQFDYYSKILFINE